MRTARGPISLLTDRKVRQAFDVARCRAEAARPLRPARVRLVAADGPPAGRGGRQPGPGEPGQQRDLGHARQHLPAPEGQALPAHRPGRLGPARRPERERPARLDPDRDGRRVRPHAADLDACPSTTSSPAATTGARSRPSSSPAAASRAAGSSARPTRSAGFPAPTPRPPRTWPPRSTRPWVCPRPSPGTTPRTGRTYVYRGDPIAGLS